MAVTKLSVQNFRNIQSAELSLDKKVNYFVGDNGSGKTSILESIFYLSHGRSFRTHLPSRIISHNQDSFVLFSETEIEQNDSVASVNTGLQRFKDGKVTIKRNKEPLDSVSQLASLTPIQLITPDSFELLSGGPGNRRKYMDWGLFHVEQSFFNLWKDYQKLLKHRNAMLRKESVKPRELKYWDQQFIMVAEQISAQRKQYCSDISGRIEGICGVLLPQYEFSFSYLQGWDKNESLAVKMAQQLERDVKLGYTSIGPHKADFRISIDNVPVDQVLSRGQLKLLVFALCVSQSVMLYELVGKRCLFIIDDLASELDDNNRSILLNYLMQVDNQLLISMIDKSTLDQLNKEFKGKVFHVEHGKITTN